MEICSRRASKSGYGSTKLTKEGKIMEGKIIGKRWSVAFAPEILPGMRDFPTLHCKGAKAQPKKMGDRRWKIGKRHFAYAQEILLKLRDSYR